MVDLPLFDFVQKYARSNTVRLHVPGHKGKGESPIYSYDITEVKGADVLYHETGILAESQKRTSDIFNTAATLYSTEGSSLCIRAMAALVKMYAFEKGEQPLIAAGRNAHKVFMTASALLGISIDWLMPTQAQGVVGGKITVETLRTYLSTCNKKPTAVYITSPDYLGNISDIKGISEICKENGILLAVDNAHGAYLRFLNDNIHPIALGADMCCDSAHKTLTALTGGAYLHISENAPEILKNNSKKAMSLFASTSPSYPILCSLDRFNGYALSFYAAQVRTTATKINLLKRLLKGNGYTVVGDEPLKLTLQTKNYGYTGDEFAEELRQKNIECEFSDPDYVVMMFTSNLVPKEFKRVKTALLTMPKRDAIKITAPVKSEQPITVIPTDKALFLPSENISVDQAVGRILASPSVSCPPAVPIAVCGERLSAVDVECFKYYGIDTVDVLKTEEI